MQVILIYWYLQFRWRSEDLGPRKVASVITLWDMSPPCTLTFLLSHHLVFIVVGFGFFYHPLWRLYWTSFSAKHSLLLSSPSDFLCETPGALGLPGTAGILPLRGLSTYNGLHKPEMVLVIKADGWRALRFEKLLLGIQETPWVFRVASELERYFKDTPAVFSWAQGMTEEEDSQLWECSEMPRGETLPGSN